MDVLEVQRIFAYMKKKSGVISTPEILITFDSI
jgi:hypothetical protein